MDSNYDSSPNFGARLEEDFKRVDSFDEEKKNWQGQFSCRSIIFTSNAQSAMLTRLISTLLGMGFWVIIAVAKSLQRIKRSHLSRRWTSGRASEGLGFEEASRGEEKAR